MYIIKSKILVLFYRKNKTTNKTNKYHKKGKRSEPRLGICVTIGILLKVKIKRTFRFIIRPFLVYKNRN